MPLTPEALYMQLGRLIAEMPNLAAMDMSAREQRAIWLGHVVALLEATGIVEDGVDASALKITGRLLEAGPYAGGISHGHEIRQIVHRALARAELRAPASAQGTFVAAGNSFEAFAAIGKVLSTAKIDVLMVDPYADETMLTHYALQAPDGVVVRVLTDKIKCKPTLVPAGHRWQKQYGQSRPLEIRAAAAPLHDRLILVDQTTASVLGQSFKDFAEEAHSSIVNVDAQTAALKIEAYADMWKAGTPLI
jgi:hypothetical protein